MSAIIVDTSPLPFDCMRCNGTGIVAAEWCMECGGAGCDWFDRSTLMTLAHNLAVAGALCEADANGYVRGYHDGMPGPRDPHPDWRPGCGRSAV